MREEVNQQETDSGLEILLFAFADLLSV